MHLPRHTISSQVVAPAFVSAAFSSTSTSSNGQTGLNQPSHAEDDLYQGSLFSCATRTGFLVAQTCPLKVVARRGKCQGGS